MVCDGCKWWSEMVAQSLGCGPIEAMCLNPESSEYQRMIRDGCSERKSGRAVDDPTPIGGDGASVGKLSGGS